MLLVVLLRLALQETAAEMPRRAFFRTLSGTFSKQQESSSDQSNGKLVKVRTPGGDAGGSRRASFTVRAKLKRQASSELEVSDQKTGRIFVFLGEKRARSASRQA